MQYVNGTALYPEDQTEVLRRYLHRFTRDHKPTWARELRPNGKPYPVQFASDSDWLKHTQFAVRKDSRLDNRMRFCRSNPTWPDGQG